jgi:hypothetical protein
MPKLDVPASYAISSYGNESDGKFSLLFAPPEARDPKSDSRAIELSMEPKTLVALACYLGDEE